MAYAKGKYSQSISDRSGQAFPYKEMVKEWNGSWVHISEFEAKHPQLDPKYHQADPEALWNARPQDFSFLSGGNGEAIADLTLPGEFAFMSNGMQPDDGSLENRKRQATTVVGKVTIVIT